MSIVFFQTSDAHRYADMLFETARTVRAYCGRHGFAYESFTGLKRGFHPWQAAFNRIYIFQELLARGRHDWAVYMDADAYVADLQFDLSAYLADKSDVAAVVTPSGATDAWWDINDGVFILNLRHPGAKPLLDAWQAAYEAIPDEVLQEQPNWSNPDDQEMIQEYLRGSEDRRAEFHIAPRSLINSVDASFIRQFVRAYAPDLNSRTRAIRAYVDEIMDVRHDERAEREREREQEIVDMVSALYLTILGRGADEMGMAYYVDLAKHVGVGAGAQMLVADFLKSAEYRDRLRSLAEVAAAA